MDQNVGIAKGRPAQAQAKVFDVISPHTEQSIAEVAAAGPADVEAAVNAARAAFDSGSGGRCEPSERVAAIRRLADGYDQRRTDMANTITAEIGAPITFSQRAQVGLPALMMRAFCDLAERHRWQETRPGFFGADVLIQKQPVGVIAAIVPGTCPSSSSSPNWCRLCWPAAR
jgi:aldehyde dehydrogenase (NAD+)